MYRNYNRDLQRKRGAVLGLVVVSTLVLAILGVGLIMLIMQLGGGQEIQHATDSGNLNVAKQVLRHPGIKLQSGDEQNIFGDTIDPETNEANLLYYNRLVAQALLIQNNAAVLNTGNASSHSSAMMNLVNGIAGRLNDQLVTSGNFDKHFHDTAQNHAMRMFEQMGNNLTHIGQSHEVSHMARGAATNVHITNAQILNKTGVTPPKIDDFAISGPDGKLYLVGYKQLTVNGGSSLWGVPLRPTQPPHLVSDKNFVTNQPRGPIPQFVPPNSFKSAGLTKDLKASNMSTRALSSSIVGSLKKVWQAQIPRGVIVVDNKGAFCGSVTKGDFDIWVDKLMAPNYIEVLGPDAATGLITDDSNGSLQNIKDFVDSNYDALMAGDQSARDNLAARLGNAGLDSWGGFPSNPTANANNPDFIRFIHDNSATRCTNGASPVATSASSSKCNLGKFMSLYGQGSGGGTSNNDCNLMAVEKYHVDLCTVRASGAECANVNSQSANSGLKLYPQNGNCGLTNVTQGTLAQLLAQTNSSSEVTQQLVTYMNQINPEAEDINNQIASVLGSVVTFDKISYIYRNPNNNKLVLSTQAPPWPLPDLNNPGMNLPDGPTSKYYRQVNMDALTNCDGECGYPHPWDCPMGSQASGQDWTEWTPSSGFRNILGVLKFRNRADGGGTFCCPC